MTIKSAIPLSRRDAIDLCRFSLDVADQLLVRILRDSNPDQSFAMADDCDALNAIAIRFHRNFPTVEELM